MSFTDKEIERVVKTFDDWPMRQTLQPMFTELEKQLQESYKRLIKEIEREVIGKDYAPQGILGDDDYIATVAENQLRKEQRKKLAEYKV